MRQFQGPEIMPVTRSICIYCGSQPGNRPVFVETATALGLAMAEAGIGLVYGGGAKGIMGAVADAVLAGGGEVTGVIPQFLIEKESSGDSLTRLTRTIVTADMHERKHTMFELSDAFVALPGGIGTLEEIVEVMTWGQLGRHSKPICLANVEGFWNPFLELLGEMGGTGFIHTASKVKPLVLSQVGEIVPAINSAWAHSTAGEGDAGVIARL
ncbi:MAG: TIGR00730 family Rossman fold protein [Nitratireductor sp.]